MSFGIAGWSETMRDGSPLVQVADAALYRAKNGGRDQVLVADGTFAPASILILFGVTESSCPARGAGTGGGRGQLRSFPSFGIL